MAENTFDPFEKIIRDAGEGWLIDWYAPKSDALPYLRGLLHSVDTCGKARFGPDVETFDENILIEEYRVNPHRVQAFLQVLGSIETADMLLMAWRIINGRTIAEVRMNYLVEMSFSLYVRLSSEDGGSDEVYESTEIDDAKLLRHFGIMKMNEQPVFDGFFPLRT